MFERVFDCCTPDAIGFGVFQILFGAQKQRVKPGTHAYRTSCNSPLSQDLSLIFDPSPPIPAAEREAPGRSSAAATVRSRLAGDVLRKFLQVAHEGK